MKDRTLYDYAMRMVGLPYIWGGNDPVLGFDCSGLVIELLVSIGAWPAGIDTNAQGLYQKFIKPGSRVITGSEPYMLGDLVFYGSAFDKVGHVAMCIDEHRVIEAGGGRDTTKTRDDAIRHDAYVRLRPVKYRKDFLAVVRF